MVQKRVASVKIGISALKTFDKGVISSAIYVKKMT